jgi:hypothetical protein
LLGVDEQESLPHRAEDRPVVLVHPGDLTLAHAVGLAAQAPGDQPGAQQPGEQRGAGGEADAGEVADELAVEPVDLDADRDQRHDLVVVHHGHHGTHRQPERADVLLGEGLAPGGTTEVADEPLADLLGIGVGVAGAVGVHDHDEVRAGVAAHLLREGQQPLGRVVDAHLLAYEGGVGHRPRHREGLRPRALAGVAAGVPRGQRDGRHHEDDDHGDLQQQDLAGDGTLTRLGRPSSHAGIVPVPAWVCHGRRTA